MADPEGATPLLPGLLDEIVIWEILVRLSPKPLLRCRAVSPAWRRATSTRDFLISHHARQPALPLFYSRSDLADGGRSLDIVPFDHRAGVSAADRFQSVARLQTPPYQVGLPFVTLLLHLEASRDGLLLLSNEVGSLYICNPATRQYASLQQLHGFGLLELYPHPPTGEYRLLLHRLAQDQRGIYVFTIGSSLPPRHIGCPGPNGLEHILGLLFQGSIHWYTDNGIMVFNTTDESFRQIRTPVACDYARLFEMGDMLGIFFTNDEDTAIDIWVMQDYQGEVWDFMRRVELPVADISHQCQSSWHEEGVMVVPGDDQLATRWSGRRCEATPGTKTSNQDRREDTSLQLAHFGKHKRKQLKKTQGKNVVNNMHKPSEHNPAGKILIEYIQRDRVS